MAHSVHDGEQLKEARKLRELFKGRFSDEESVELLKQHGNLSDAVDFVLNSDPGEVRKFINDRNNALVAKLKQDSRYVRTALAQGMEASSHLFACGPCDRYWWRKVPARKQVSKCKLCTTKYDPVPRDQEWGLAKFQCGCGNVFWGAGWMNHTESPCYKCHSPVRPQEIVPPARDRFPKKVRTPHSCTGANCHNRAPSYRAHTSGYYFHDQPTSDGRRSQTSGSQIEEPDDSVCPHEQSIRKVRVLFPSARHASSGSTVTTFMTQDDLAEDYEDLPSLPGVPEQDED